MGRMKQGIMALAAVGLLAGPAWAQQGDIGGRPARPDSMRQWMAPGSMARNPVAVLLERREQLQLTDEQVQRLEALGARVERENAPRIEQLRAVLGDRSFRDLSDEERAAVRDRMRELEPVRDALRETNRAAMTEARGILTAEQATQLRETMRRGMRDRPANRPNRPDRPQRPGRPGRPGGLR